MHYILLSVRKPLHGYGMKQWVLEKSEQEVNLAAGTLYGAIENLKKNRYIELITTKNERKKNYVKSLIFVNRYFVRKMRELKGALIIVSLEVVKTMITIKIYRLFINNFEGDKWINDQLEIRYKLVKLTTPGIYTFIESDSD